MEILNDMLETDRRLDELFERRLVGNRHGILALLAAPSAPFRPATNVFERNGDLVMQIDLPGIDPATDVSAMIDKGEVVVRGERHRPAEIRNETVRQREWAYGLFERRIAVPRPITSEQISTTYTGGILEVVLPTGDKVQRISARSRRRSPVRKHPTRSGRTRSRRHVAGA